MNDKKSFGFRQKPDTKESRERGNKICGTRGNKRETWIKFPEKKLSVYNPSVRELEKKGPSGEQIRTPWSDPTLQERGVVCKGELEFREIPLGKTSSKVSLTHARHG